MPMKPVYTEIDTEWHHQCSDKQVSHSQTDQKVIRGGLEGLGRPYGSDDHAVSDYTCDRNTGQDEVEPLSRPVLVNLLHRRSRRESRIHPGRFTESKPFNGV